MSRCKLLLLVVALIAGFGLAAAGEAKKLTFGLVVKDGAQKAVDEMGGTLIFDGPADNNDIQGQVAIMENLITSKIDAILLTPLDSDALVAPVEKAMKAGIPVVIIDSGVNTDNYVTFIATDNVSCGRIAMAKLVELIGGEGEVAIINALVVQQPYEMDRMGVEMAVKALNGESVPKSVTPDVVVATRENMNDPVIHKVLFPAGE